MANCIFCQLISDPDFKSIHRDDMVMAFDDITPQAPVHFLVVPRRHIDRISELDDPGVLGSLFGTAHRIARERGIADAGYRLVFNQGPDGGQTVHHVHLHVLGGRQLTWPPG